MQTQGQIRQDQDKCTHKVRSDRTRTSADTRRLEQTGPGQVLTQGQIRQDQNKCRHKKTGADRTRTSADI